MQKAARSMSDSKDKKGKILVIVPHEDDEINVAGSAMYRFVQQGYEVYCAFTTNGDYSFWATTRIHEAVRSLTILGVRHIYFLGYGDTSNFYTKGHVFYADQGAVTSPAGRTATYGTSDYPDYAWVKRHVHSPYDRGHFKEDLQSLILDVHADIIFCVDYDVHADHRACSILFEEIVGDILHRPDNDYYPVIFKGFAYCTSFGAPADFYETNLKSVPHPSDEPDRIIDWSLYEWGNRVRFPVSPECRTTYIHQNVLYKALFEHKSQSAALHAIRIINGDAVFWQRRTDSLSYKACVTATSGQAGRVTDFKLLDTTDIDTKRPVFDAYVWMPDDTDGEKKLYFHWQEGQSISQIRCFGTMDAKSRVLKWKISFDTGFTAVYGPMPVYGKAFVAAISPQHDVHHCVIQILEWTGSQYGFAECEFFSCPIQQTRIDSFVKLTIDDEFAYDYFLLREVSQCQLGVYAYPTRRPVVFTILSGDHSEVDATGIVRFGPDDKVVRVQVSVKEDTSVHDEITLYRVGAVFFWKQRLLQRLEKWLLTGYLKKYRKYIHIQHKYLKKL
jgi:LmbE family N-acetylglucosaminyl deacetylase